MSATPIPARLELAPSLSLRTAVAVRARPRLTSLALAAIDALAVIAAAQLGYLAWRHVNADITAANLFHPLALTSLFVAAYGAFGLYSAAGPGPVEELRRMMHATGVVALVLTAAAFLTKGADQYSRGAFLATALLAALFVPLGRAGLRRLCAVRPWWGVPVLIFGAGTSARMVVRKLAAEPGLGLKPVACLDDDPGKRGECLGVPVLGPLALAPALAESCRIRHLIVAMPGLERSKLLEILERYAGGFSRIILIPNLFGVASLWVAPRDLGGILGLELRQNLLDPGARFLKRLLDLALAAILGLVAAPVIAAASLWIRRVSPGPALYWQEREGAGGAVIRVPKLRTMHCDGERMLAAYLETSPEAREEWLRYCKLRRDPRVIPGIGRWLRRTSLDELPQLWNVLRGEMSLVGPRPFPAYHLERFEPEFRALRARVRPGLTGLWQVAARSDGDLDAQRELDTYYIRNWSLWLELYILVRTVGVIVSGKGAY
jgi:Undecaprenyl-phosphate galactose phosphotransferase WbaP